MQQQNSFNWSLLLIAQPNVNYIRHNSNNKNTTGKNVNNTRQKKIIKKATSKQFGYDLIVINLVLFSIHFVKIFPQWLKEPRIKKV